MAILMIIIVRNSLNPFSQKDVVVVENPGKEDMRITAKDGQEIKKYQTSGTMGEGEGVRAGHMIYVPEGKDKP